MEGESRPIGFEGLDFPVWVAVSTVIERSMGESHATPHLIDNEDQSQYLPLFAREEQAQEYIENRNLFEHEPRRVHDLGDLLLRLQLFRKLGGNYVAINELNGPEEGSAIFTVESFIQHIKSQA